MAAKEPKRGPLALAKQAPHRAPVNQAAQGLETGILAGGVDLVLDRLGVLAAGGQRP